MMRKGFTLAEILIVIAMISLLFVAISPLLRGNQDQAMLSRQADLVRQSFYETVMKAKTGAAEEGAETLPLRGFLASKGGQEIRSLVWTDLTFTEAKGESISGLVSKAKKGVNLLTTDVGKVLDKPLATLESITIDGGEAEEFLLLLEPVSNDVAVLGAGTSLPASITMTLSHAQSTRMTRSMTIQPGTATITESDD